MTRHQHSFDDVAATAQALADAVATDLRAALAQQPRALLLVSGGRSPIPFFAALARAALPWERIDVSLVDERSVAPDHEDANARLVHAHLLTGAAAAAGWIALMPPDVIAGTAGAPTASAGPTDAHAASAAGPVAHPPDAHAAFAAAERAASRASDDVRLRHPAVIVLGIGNDGHTASLFPDAPQWPQARVTSRRYVALQPPNAPHARISLSLPALRSQARCYLWAAGADKLETLARLQATCDALPGSSETGNRPGSAAPGNMEQPDVSPALAAAGPVACLLADPAVRLEVYACP